MNQKTERMKAYQANIPKTREMLSIFLGQLGFAAMAKDVLTDDADNLPRYARVVIHNLTGDIKTKFQAGCRAVQLI